MPFISAIVCSLIGGALGGFIFANVLGTVSFLPAFATVSACSLLGTILFVAASNISPAPATQTQLAPDKPQKSGGKGASQSGNKPRGDRGRGGKSGGGQKPRPNKPKPKVTSTASGPVEQGEVKRFFGNKGYGFIRRENGEEVFVHYRSIEGGDDGDGDGGRRYLKEGQSVEFVVVDTDRGPQAENVRAL